MAFDFPAAPTDGQTFTPVGGPTYIFKTPAWMIQGGSAEGTIIADTAPPGPHDAGQFWWESDTGTLFIWYDDGTSQQWVQAAGAAGGSSATPLTFGVGLTETAGNVDLDAATTAIIGGLMDAPSDGSIYGRKDALWVPTSTAIAKQYSASATWTKPVGLKSIKLLATSGAGGGGGCMATTGASQASAGGGGGGGALLQAEIPAAGLPATVAITIGAGGAKGAAGGGAGGDGGSTIFGTIFTLTGGVGGSAGGLQNVAFMGAPKRGGGISAPNFPAGSQAVGGTGYPGTGGFYGITNALGGNGGGSAISGGAVGLPHNSAGNDGAGYGAGAGGAGAASAGAAGAAMAGGNGGPGVILLTEYF